jgi:nucleotide-binding universal stress UspA family protein
VKKILVPVDGSQLSEEAVVPALALAARHRATLELVHAVPDLAGRTPPGKSETFKSWLAEEETRGRAYLDQLRSRLEPAGVKVSTHVLVSIGLVAESILELADKLQVDLLVLTSHGRGRWDRLWLGSVADRMVRTAKPPLLLLRSPDEGSAALPASGSPKHVLVPLDGTPEAEAVLDTLGEICEPGGSRVTLASVLPSFATLATPYAPETLADITPEPEREERLNAYLEGVRARLRGNGMDPVDHRVIRDNDVARSLLGVVESEGIDLVALSTHGRQGLDRLMLGSVVDKLVRGSRTAVLTVRRKGDS